MVTLTQEQVMHQTLLWMMIIYIYLCPVHTLLILKQILKRQNTGKTLDSRGKNLLDYCISYQLRILNGRVLGDAFGEYTCFTPQGCSVVDYVIVTEGILDQILYFCINDFVATISDCHCMRMGII